MRHTLYYTGPAAEWHDALPVGNGRMGAMIYGRPSEELIQLNEDSIWSGEYRNRNNPLAKNDLEKLRKLISEEKAEEAEKLVAHSFYGTNDQQRHYMPLGDLHIDMQAEGCENYSHTLSLSEAVDTVRFTADGTVYERKTIASYPDQVIAVIFTADKPGRISFTAYIGGRDDSYDRNCAYDGSTLLFTASDGIAFSCAVTASAAGGSCRTEANRIICEGADSAVLIIAAQTAYRTGDHENMAVSQAKSAARKTAAQLMSRHISDHRRLFDRCSLDLYRHDSSLPTSERLEAVKNGAEDIGLAELYFDFSRYLMIAGSREGSLPLNLQGIWNKDMWPAWGSKYTVNINTEMNYWGAEMQNLPECHTPLFDHIERMREHGRVTAREMYGCGGTVCHHNTDIWGDTAPQDYWMPATLWPMGMAWLCLHLWEHYQFTGDAVFLAEKYDTMREACEFFLDFLIEDSEGRLVTNPSLSPENTYIGKNGKEGRLCEGAAMDSELIYSLFSAVISADEILGGADAAFTERLKEVRGRLPKLTVGKYGQICEWSHDYDEAEPGHRHISQLFALYPSDMITPEGTPELAKAAAATLERRLSFGGGHTGWSRAWIINMYARLYNGAKVAENINALLAKSTALSLLDMHPPFQIDGNFGGGAGICEALFQSVGGVLRFLPALPPSWTKGRLTGIAARGAFTVCFDWEDSRPVYAKIVSHAGGMCRIRYSDSINVNGRTVYPEDGICSFETEKGVYKIIF